MLKVEPLPVIEPADWSLNDPPLNAVPVAVNVKIVPLPSTLSTVIVQSFAVVPPPNAVPKIVIVSLVVKLAPALFTTAV